MRGMQPTTEMKEYMAGYVVDSGHLLAAESEVDGASAEG